MSETHGSVGSSLPSRVIGFMFIMLISGALNTLLMKFMVVQSVPTGPGAQADIFDHPYFQSLLMMIGEFLCLIVFWVSRDTTVNTENVPKHIFAVACLFDWIATTLVNMAYVLIAASVVQMTRGAVVIFTCLFSVMFLGRKQHQYHLVGVFLVFLGITLVSMSSLVSGPTSTSSAGPVHQKLLGIGLCIAAQVFQATMLVYEENIMSKYTIPPLLVVGMEGTFGFLFGVVLLVAVSFLNIEHPDAALYQMTHSTPLLCAAVGSIFSIAFFNFSGVTVTKHASATARSTIDVSRTVLIWVVELAMGWNSFSKLQLLGFIILAIGTMVYNRLIIIKSLEPKAETASIIKRRSEVP